MTEPRTGVRFIIQRRGRINGGAWDPWADAQIPRFKTLYEAMAIHDLALKAAKEDSDPISRMFQELTNAFGVETQIRIVKRSITVVDELIDEASTVLVKGRS